MSALLVIVCMQATDAVPRPEPPPDAAPASADAAPAPAPPDDDLERQLAEAVAADRGPAPAPAPAPGLGSAALANPEISVIGTFTGAWRLEDEDPAFQAGDDPLPQGIGAQVLELVLAAAVDPYLKMFAVLTIPNQEALEIEEAYLTTTTLPWNLLLKAGIFRSSFGRNNEQHLHVQDFPRRPLATALLDDDGLRPPGAQLSVLLPLPWFATLYGEVLSLDPGALSGVAGLEQFFALSDTWSLLVGANAATLDRGATAPREYLLGGDVYVKWRPANVTRTYAWVAFAAEAVASRTADRAWDGAGHAQLVAQVARRLRLGARFDATGVAAATAAPRAFAATASIAFLPTEYSRLRLSVAQDLGPALFDRRNTSVFLQLEGTIGAHGAHPF